jgi:hypothetical protein
MPALLDSVYRYAGAKVFATVSSNYAPDMQDDRGVEVDAISVRE